MYYLIRVLFIIYDIFKLHESQYIKAVVHGNKLNSFLCPQNNYKLNSMNNSKFISYFK